MNAHSASDKFSAWGAAGGNAVEGIIKGYGAYTSGNIYLNENEIIYVYVGGKGALYDTTGQVINYTIDEVEVNTNDLVGYTKSIDGYTITNTIVKHKITTEVNGQGGTISGEGQDPYEEVNHKANSPHLQKEFDHHHLLK